MEPLSLIPLVLIAMLLFRLLAGSMDQGRLESYIADKGWTLVDRHWEPFGPGWFGEKDSRIYRITYRDEEGALYEAHAKTSMMSGVYLTNERLIRARTTAEPTAQMSLEQENEALKRRIEELEAERS